jgi:hypothetical protein
VSRKKFGLLKKYSACSSNFELFFLIASGSEFVHFFNQKIFFIVKLSEFSSEKKVTASSCSIISRRKLSINQVFQTLLPPQILIIFPG